MSAMTDLGAPPSLSSSLEPSSDSTWPKTCLRGKLVEHPVDGEGGRDETYTFHQMRSSTRSLLGIISSTYRTIAW